LEKSQQGKFHVFSRLGNQAVAPARVTPWFLYGGADRDRTDDLLNAIRSRYILADWLLVTFW